MPRIFQHRLQVVDDTAARAHAITRKHDRWTARTFEVIGHLLVPGMGINGNELVEPQRIAPLTHSPPGLGAPVIVQLTVGAGDALRQGRVENDGQL
ncbi:hypothetical protein D3C79_869190 [compost metagenome]